MKNKCPKCQIVLVEGKALMSTFVMSPDFIGDDPKTMTIGTVNPGGPGKMVKAMKCPKCGYSEMSN